MKNANYVWLIISVLGLLGCEPTPEPLTNDQMVEEKYSGFKDASWNCLSFMTRKWK